MYSLVHKFGVPIDTKFLWCYDYST